MALRVLMVTSEWPTPESPTSGCFVAQQARFLEMAGVDVDVLHFRGRRRPIAYFKIWRRVRKAIRAGGHDLVHAQFGHSGALAVTPKRLPTVVTFRGDDLEGVVGAGGRYRLAGRLFQRASLYAARKADATIVVSRRLARHLPAAPAGIIPSGLDFDLFKAMPREAARAKLGLPREGSLVLFVGDPQVPVKRYPLAAAAIDLVADAELVLAWGVPRESIPTYMSAADVLLLVSVHEGSPNVVKEALACDLPVVATDVGDVRERIQDVAGCVVCDDDEPETIAAALAEVLAAGKRVEGRKAVASLDERELTKQVIGIYENVVGHGRLDGSAVR